MKNSPHKKYKRNPNQLFSDVDGEIVMLSTELSEYYGLTEVSSAIWRFINKPKSLLEITSYLEISYDVNHDTCLTETTKFLEESVKLGIIIFDGN